MYSQYQQYQGATAVATQQQGMTWNGSQWVQNGYAVASSTQPTYASATVAQPPSPNLVKLYTQYYHDWKKKETEEEGKVQVLYGEKKQEATRQAAWAKYYADQASRAAHYYHNPQGPKPDLPPAPPASKSSTAPQSSYHQPQQPQPQPQPSQYQQPQQQPAKTESPGGLKRYVHNCLSRCKGKEELAEMQKEVQMVISQALKQGNMHTTNWDSKPLIPLPNESLQQQTTSSYSQNARDNVQAPSSYAAQNVNGSSSFSSQSSGYYGPSGGNTQATSPSSYRRVAKDKYSNNLPSNNSYYGNTSTFTTESKSIGGDYNIELPKISKKQKKAAKKRKADTDGFQRSNDTLAKRANRFSGAGGIYDVSNSATTVARNIDKYMGKELIGGSKKLDETDYERMTVKGTCQNLEKDYLRLTAPPKAELVRPQPVLEKHLQNLIAERQNRKKRREYPWFCSQFKAMRQDLTVQRIFNAFAVEVYEAHARVALEEKDLNEYNQCQTQLKELYVSLRDDAKAMVNRNEFIAYRLIYYVFLTGNKKYDGGSADLFNIMLSLTPDQRREPSIAHALKVRSAVADFDYHAFFRLQNESPRSGAVYLMDFMVPTVRQWSLHRICKAYRPSISAEFALTELGFEKDEFEHASKWLESCGCVLSDDRTLLVTKDSVVHESDWKEQNSLI